MARSEDTIELRAVGAEAEHQRTYSEASCESLPEKSDGLSYPNLGLSPHRERSRERSQSQERALAGLNAAASSPPGVANQGSQLQHGVVKDPPKPQIGYKRTVAVFALCAIFLVVFAMVVGHQPDIRDDGGNQGKSNSSAIAPTKDPKHWLNSLYCKTPFGTNQGSSFGVSAMSNCNDSYTSFSFSFFPMFQSHNTSGEPQQPMPRVLFGPYIRFSNQTTASLEDFKFQNFTFSSLDTSFNARETVREMLWKASTKDLVIQEPRLYSGMKWQCVEYARRFLILNLGLTFGDVDGAHDIWALAQAQSVLHPIIARYAGTHYTAASQHFGQDEKDRTISLPFIQATTSSAEDGARRPVPGGFVNFTLPQLNNMTSVQNFTFTGYPNAGTKTPPEVGDLIIYPRQKGNEMPYGHVAVVVNVILPDKAGTVGSVWVAEENWSAGLWSSPGFTTENPWKTGYPVWNITLQRARTIPLRYQLNALGVEVLEMVDPWGYKIFGWKRAECPCN